MVVPLYSATEAAETRRNVIGAVGEFEDFKPDLPTVRGAFPDYAIGGFGALGVATSFHHPIIREIRERAHPVAQSALMDIADGRQFEQIIDRLMLRPPGKQPTREQWHRDVSPMTANEDDDIFGGWVNLDAVPQYFSCIRGSHNDFDARMNLGFATSILRDSHLDKKVRVEVPPGHLLIFYECVMHEVLSNRAPPAGSVRLFTGWRLTHSNMSLFPDLEWRLRTNAPMRLKSGQEPPMYAKLHWTNWVEKLQDWATATLAPELLTTRTVASGKRAGQTFTIPFRFATSRQLAGLPLYEYRHSEVEMYFPR